MERTVPVCVCALLLLAGCGPERGATRPEEASMSPTTSSSPEGNPTRVREAVADLAARLSVAEEEVVVESVEEVTWRDGSIGCAEPGRMYTQALVDGSRIVLRAGGDRYEYHSGGPRGVFLCEDPTQ